MIKRFDAISVREESAISLIREQLHWDVDVIQTLDPTMLLDITDYKSLVGQVVNNNKIFVYILDSSVQKYLLLRNWKRYYVCRDLLSHQREWTTKAHT